MCKKVIYYISLLGTKINAYFDQHAHTIRHVSYHWLLTDLSKQRCQVCVQYRENFLRGKLRSTLDHSKQDGTDPSSHANYRYLDTPNKDEETAFFGKKAM